MEPDLRDEDLPQPAGTTFNLDPDRVIQHLQQRAAGMIQQLQWELAKKDALAEALQERLQESENLRQEAEGALEAVGEELREAREGTANLVRGEGFLMERIEGLTQQLSEARKLPQPDAFLEAPSVAERSGDDARTETSLAVPSSPKTPTA